MSDIFSLRGKVAIVTGGSSGIGFAIANGLVDAGATVFGLGRSGLSTARALVASGADVWAWDDDETARQRGLEHNIPIVDLYQVDFSKTTVSIKKKLKKNLVITQGFIGSNSNGFNTTLGREGSDYTAAIFANALDSKKATIWKDVEGIFTKDPVIFNDAEHISHISYFNL